MSNLWQVTVTVTGSPDTEALKELDEKLAGLNPDAGGATYQTWGATYETDPRRLRIFGEVQALNKRDASEKGLAAVRELLPGGYVAEVAAKLC